MAELANASGMDFSQYSLLGIISIFMDSKQFSDFTVRNHLGQEIALTDYKGQVVLAVNTASACGFTPQYSE